MRRLFILISLFSFYYYCCCLEFLGLTVVDVVRDTATALTIDVAHILLQARVCDAAGTGGDGAVGVCALRHGSCESREGEDDGGGSEVHFENCCCEVICNSE